MSSTASEPSLEEKVHAGLPIPVPSGKGIPSGRLSATTTSFGSFPAAAGEQAIRDAAAIQTADPDVDTSGVLTYVAVPRSFQPVEVTAKVEPKIEFRTKS